MRCHSIESRRRKPVKGYEILLFERTLPNKYGKKYWILLQKQDWMS